MTFASEAAKPNSERFALVKITPARYVGGDLASAGGGVYDMAWTYPINRVERNGTALTEVSSTPGTNDQWYWDGTTLEIKLAAAPSATNVIVVFYDLFYTSGEYRITTTDPEDSATAERHWEPRLMGMPEVKQNVSDIVNGVVSSSSTSIRLANTDLAFQNYLTSTDSFYQKTVKVWFCANGVSNIQKVFEGRVQSITVNNNDVLLSLFDGFAKLDQPALFGDTAKEAYWLRESGSFPNVYPPDQNTPIPMVLTKKTRAEYTTEPTAPGDKYFDGRVYPELVAEKMMKAVCTDYSEENPTLTNNLYWGLCRFNSNGPRTLDFGNITGIDKVDDGASEIIIYVQTDSHNLNIYDSFELRTTGAQPTLYGHVIENREFTYNAGGGTKTYQFAVWFENVASASTVSITTSTHTFESHNGPAVVLVDKYSSRISRIMTYGEEWGFVAGGANITTTSAGNKYAYIILNAVSSGNPDPASQEIRFVYGAADGYLHGEVVQDLAEGAGLTVNTSSITAANTSLAVNTAMTIPQFDETDFASYRKYLEMLCKSTMGIVYFNNSSELVYELLAAPSSTNSITESKFRDIRVSLEYRDIVTQLIAYNPALADKEALDAANSPSETVESLIALHLHETRNVVRFRHVLEEITSRIQDIFDILSNRRALYRFITATDNLASKIGDDLQLDADEVLGGSGSVDLKIVGLDKSPDEVDVEATDLLDI